MSRVSPFGDERRPAAHVLAVAVTTALAIGCSVAGVTLELSSPAEAFSRVGSNSTPGTAFTAGIVVQGIDFVLIVLVGALLTLKLPRHPIGWLLLAVGVLASIAIVTGGYVIASALEPGWPSPLTELSAWLANWVWPPAIAAIAAVMLLFPSGRTVSRAWGRGFLAVLAIAAVIMVLAAQEPGPMPQSSAIDNPFASKAVAGVPLDLLAALGASLTALVLLASGSMAMRYRRGSEVERLQLKWVVVAGSAVAVAYGITTLRQPWDELSGVVAFTVLAAFPIAIGVAILRYRLYAIDLIIRRTLVYGTLTVILGVGYAAGVVLFQALLEPLTGGDILAVAAATLAVAGAFTPLRRRLQEVIDRRFYRVRYDAERATASLAARLGREVDLEVIESDLVDAVVDAVRPRLVGVWHRPSVPPAVSSLVNDRFGRG